MDCSEPKPDVIIILGGGITSGGALSEETKERLTLFCKEKENLSGIPIILSGRWSCLQKARPLKTEALAMKEYLETCHIKGTQIILEEKSLDTVGNVVFAKEIISKHKDWKNILFITSYWHVKRALLIFNRVMGSKYKIQALQTSSTKDTYSKRKDFERLLFLLTKIILNTGSTWTKFLEKTHPFRK